MTNHYIYLVSSLPMLHLGGSPPFSFKRLIEICKPLISEKDLEIVRTAHETEGYNYKGEIAVLKKWRAFDIAIRNELAKIRASRKKKDAAKFLREEEEINPSISHTAAAIYRNPSIIEREKALDREIWNFLEWISFGHYFDLEILIIYALKLRILEKWDKIKASDAGQLVEETLRKA